jgi:conserved oligomeric Golgi complex subunit 3
MATAKRANAVTTLPPPHLKPTLNLEEWEAKAPLSELQNRSVSLLKSASEHSALPVKVGKSFILRMLFQRN